MIYIIEEMVTFCSESGAIWANELFDEKVILSPIAARLLNHLIENKGVVVSRENLYTYIWENYGLIPSGNSLNNYIALIRKTLYNMSIDSGVLKTIPRVGFCLDCKIKIKNDTPFINPTLKKPFPFPPVFIKKIFLFLLLILTLISLTPPVILENQKQSSLLFIERISNCDVYYIDHGRPYTINELKKSINHLVEESKIDCRIESELFLNIDTSVFMGMQGTVHIANCKTENNKYLFCDNVVFTSKGLK